VQEALTNVVKHARARRVTIEIAAHEAHVDVAVRDDGAGFDASAPREGFGITGMRERVGLADGTLSIASSPGQGTTVSARLSRSDGSDGRTTVADVA
jgi:signal transduction histidine kinase